jgi:hypothetical protein
MLYLIGGVPRSGKSQVRNLLLKNHKISGVSIDIITKALHYSYPQLGIIENDNEQTDEEQTAILWPFVQGFIRAYRWYKSDYILEGVNLDPTLLKDLSETKYLKMCFMGYAEIDPKKKVQDIRENHSDAEWTNEMNDEAIEEMVRLLINKSKKVREVCKEFGLRYFDTSDNFQEVIKTAADYLVEKSPSL